MHSIWILQHCGDKNEEESSFTKDEEGGAGIVGRSQPFGLVPPYQSDFTVTPILFSFSTHKLYVLLHLGDSVMDRHGYR
jgi:hypothetical protein